VCAPTVCRWSAADLLVPRLRAGIQRAAHIKWPIEQADQSTKLVSNWISNEHLDKAIPNAPKITSGKVVAHSDRVLAVA